MNTEIDYGFLRDQGGSLVATEIAETQFVGRYRASGLDGECSVDRSAR
jgi:hypothetical protein